MYFSHMRDIQNTLLSPVDHISCESGDGIKEIQNTEVDNVTALMLEVANLTPSPLKRSKIV
jgi:hypothetical protein